MNNQIKFIFRRLNRFSSHHYLLTYFTFDTLKLSRTIKLSGTIGCKLKGTNI